MKGRGWAKSPAPLLRVRVNISAQWDLLRNIIAFNMEDKKGSDKFWR
ncbi:TPA: hypothetical protein ACGPBJ_001748 [Streptococcus suis]